MILFYVYMSLLWGRLAGCSPVVNCFILSANLLTCIKTCSCFVDAKIKDLTISCKFCYTCFDGYVKGGADMIKKTKQNWLIGQTVNVGFIKGLKVEEIKAVVDGLPDIYVLSLGTKRYEFIPHNGIHRIN